MIRSLALSAVLAVAGSSLFAQTLTPARGMTLGQTRVTIAGNNLVPPSAWCGTAAPAQNCFGLRVFFGEVTGTVVEASANRIVVLTPAGTARTVDVRIEIVDGATTTLPNAYVYDANAVDTPDQWVRYLVPTTLRDVHGAQGSLWTSELALYADQSLPVPLVGRFCATCMLTTLQSEQLTNLELVPGRAGTDGAFLYVPKVASYQVVKQFHIRDLSRTAETLGTELPLVARDEFRPEQILLNVPADARYRVLLRIYDDSDFAWHATVSVYGAASGRVLDTLPVELAGGPTNDSAFPLNPGYGAVNPITDAVRESGESRVRVVVSSDSFPDPPPPTDLWAFATVTNNVTQQVTAITPQ
jgi:hypothetical protein